MEKAKLVIIGSGPAGYTAALYASRAELAPTLFQGLEPGGQLMWTTDVENFPGFPEGIMGPDMMELFKKQAERFGTILKPGKIDSIDLSSRPFKMKSGEDEYEADAVILAMGASAMWLGVEGEEKYKGHGVSACATCDGFFFRDKDILVVGGGDSAMEEANFLTKFGKTVKILVRKDELKASKIMAERAKNNPKIEFIWNTEVKEVLGDGTNMTGVKVLNNKTNEESEMEAQGLFIAIGHKPNTDIVKGQIDLDERGYIKLPDLGSTATNIEGVFSAGDVHDTKYRQAVTAAGSGCMAALDAERYLSHQE